MPGREVTRRNFLAGAASTVVAAGTASALAAGAAAAADELAETGSQRLSLARLHKWESLGYGMFIHFGMSTFVHDEFADGKAAATAYAPDRLDVDQWVSVARDAGMKYILLTTKHVAGHCLWPSKHTDYTVANSTNKTNVVEQFCKACEKRGLLAGFYYCCWDNHNRFGSRTPSDPISSWEGMNTFPKSQDKLPPFTTSLYQAFQTAQITELLTQFGPIAEMFIDIPGMLGRGYRQFHYYDMARLQPETVIIMNSGISDQANYDVAYAWPSDLIALETQLPPGGGHQKWRTIEGKRYYMPGELCNSIRKYPGGARWFWFDGDPQRTDEDLRKEFEGARAGGVNYVLNVPPNKHGVIPEEEVAALRRLRKNVGI